MDNDSTTRTYEYAIALRSTLAALAAVGYRAVPGGVTPDGVLMERAPQGRTFYARVALMGHRDLGICEVREEQLAGKGLLRCTRLETETPEVHWTTSPSVYDLEELSAEEAQAEGEKSRARVKARREQEEALAARRAEREAREAEALRARRTTVSARIRATSDGLLATPSARNVLFSEDEIHLALGPSLPTNVWQEGSGVLLPGLAEGDLPALREALLGLGFASVEIASAPEATPADEDDEDECPDCGAPVDEDHYQGCSGGSR